MTIPTFESSPRIGYGAKLIWFPSCARESGEMSYWHEIHENAFSYQTYSNFYYSQQCTCSFKKIATVLHSLIHFTISMNRQNEHEFNDWFRSSIDNIPESPVIYSCSRLMMSRKQYHPLWRWRLCQSGYRSRYLKRCWFYLPLVVSCTSTLYLPSVLISSSGLPGVWFRNLLLYFQQEWNGCGSTQDRTHPVQVIG